MRRAFYVLLVGMKLNIRFGSQDSYVLILTALTVVLILTYAYAYYISTKFQGERYIPLISTTRIIVTAAFLIYFYNPLRSTFEYGHALPIIAFSAGISLLLLVNRFDLLNLAHFMLYGQLLPENPKKICRLENAAGQEVDVPAKVQ
jgi:hypothetical protein